MLNILTTHTHTHTHTHTYKEQGENKELHTTEGLN